MNDAWKKRVASKDDLFEMVLMHAAFDGWTRRALKGAANDLGIDRATATRLFPNGGESLLDWLDDWLDRKMVEAIDSEKLQGMKVRQRIASLVRARLEAVDGHKEAMRRAALARGLPRSVSRTGSSIWRTVGRIWQEAGFPADSAEGFSYYSRRVTLAGVIVSTFLYWLEDQSDGHKQSWAFLERRIDDVMRIGQATGKVKKVTEAIPGLRSFSLRPRSV